MEAAERTFRFRPANELTASLVGLGFSVRRFKTGTPARIDGRSIDYSALEIQRGETDIYPFSYMSKGAPKNQRPCYLTYTNEKRTRSYARTCIARPFTRA